MREIEFRAWDKINKSWCTMYSNADCMKNLNNPDCKIVQYTGIKDSTGKKIFEGDIILVNFSEGVWQVVIKDITRLPEIMFGSSVLSIMILGNIHENPELLEVK
jgi:hypothetical protein